MDWLYLIGRILFAMIFISAGIMGHLMKLEGMSPFAGAKKVPASKVLVLITGLMIIAGGLSIALGLWMEIGIWLLIIFLLASAFKMHDFWSIADPMDKMDQQSHFMKNVALAGAALVLYWMVETYGYGPYTLGQPM